MAFERIHFSHKLNAVFAVGGEIASYFIWSTRFAQKEALKVVRHQQ
jgi:hypothetical protein